MRRWRQKIVLQALISIALGVGASEMKAQSLGGFLDSLNSQKPGQNGAKSQEKSQSPSQTIKNLFGDINPKSDTPDGQDKNRGGGLNLGKTVGKVFDAHHNTILGPMGRYYLGRKLSAHVLGRYATLPQSDPRTKYVRSIVLTLLSASNYAGNHKEPLVIILRDKSVINAFSAPGNFVFISTGMLDFVRNEDELAFVLAHEVAHVELDHGLNAVKSKQGTDLMKDVAGNAFPGLGGLLGNMMGYMENGFSADLEAEADRRGAELAAKAGYNPRAGVNVIRRLEKSQGHQHAKGYPKDRTSIVARVADASSQVSEKLVQIRSRRFDEIIRNK